MFLLFEKYLKSISSKNLAFINNHENFYNCFVLFPPQKNTKGPTKTSCRRLKISGASMINEKEIGALKKCGGEKVK